MAEVADRRYEAGSAAHDLTLFQAEALRAIAAIEHEAGDEPYGLAIKRRLEGWYDQDVHHGRIYPNLDELVERGLVEKGSIDRRTNSYHLTDEGAMLLQRRAAEWLRSVEPLVDVEVQVDDFGGDRQWIISERDGARDADADADTDGDGGDR